MAQSPHPKPIVAWIHLLNPHGPPVWQADGRPSDPMAVPLSQSFWTDVAAPGQATQYSAGYRANLAGFQPRFLATLDALIAADPEAVIIVFSDHGSGSHYDLRAASGNDLTERFATLFAARTPGQPGLYQSPVTPLKIFPPLFNAYLGLSIPPVADADGAWAGPFAGASGLQYQPVPPAQLLPVQP
jgi:hypothetical protein